MQNSIARLHPLTVRDIRVRTRRAARDARKRRTDARHLVHSREGDKSLRVSLCLRLRDEAVGEVAWPVGVTGAANLEDRRD